MLEDTLRQSIADELYACYRAPRQITLLTKQYPDIEMEDAYRIQERVVEHFKSDGARVRGYKVGLTSKPMQDMAGTNEPDYSALLDEMFVPEAGQLQRSRFNSPMVEIEIAFVLKERLAGPALTVVDIIRAVDFVLPSIEVVDLRVAMAPGMDVRDTIADLAAVGAVVLGGRPMNLTDIDLRSVNGQLLINDEVRESGPAAAVLGNPLNAVVWLANKLGSFGVAFEPGDIVLSGSFIRLAAVNAGDRVTARFDGGLGDVTVEFV